MPHKTESQNCMVPRLSRFMGDLYLHLSQVDCESRATKSRVDCEPTASRLRTDCATAFGHLIQLTRQATRLADGVGMGRGCRSNMAANFVRGKSRAVMNLNSLEFPPEA